MLRDRGTIKWTSMMLPEHVKLLREWVKEDSYEQKKELDEQQWEAMNEVVLEAIEFNKTIAVTYYRNKRYEITIGEIHCLDELKGTMSLIDRFTDVHRIELSAIVDIRFIEE